jgi:hypothetical protein
MADLPANIDLRAFLGPRFLRDSANDLAALFFALGVFVEVNLVIVSRYFSPI